MKIILTLAFITLINFVAISQDTLEIGIKSKGEVHTFLYAYISVQHKFLSEKFEVEVDFGDSPEQVKAGKEYSRILTNTKSYAAILNYMAERQFELVNTLNYTSTFQGSGGSYAIAFIMRKKN